MPALPYITSIGGVQTVLGHYAVAQKSGNFTGWSAGDKVGRIRWAPGNSNTYCVLERLKFGIVTQATATVAAYDVSAFIYRQFTVDFTTAITSINLATTAKSNAMRSTMAPSLMGASGPGIATTTTMSGQTGTADAAGFAFGVMNMTGTTVGISTMATLYERTAEGQHPIVLSNNEGVVVQMLTASAGGTYNVYLQWEWCEVSAFTA